MGISLRAAELDVGAGGGGPVVSNDDKLVGGDRKSLQAEVAASSRSSLINSVGLFGTCGGSTWRDGVMNRLSSAGVGFFNPVVPNWTPECAAEEAKHLAGDKALIMNITGETEAYGSLAETGWAQRSAENNGQDLYFVIQDFKEVGKDVDPKHPANRARKLVKAHAEKAGVKIYTDVDKALDELLTKMKN